MKGEKMKKSLISILTLFIVMVMFNCHRVTMHTTKDHNISFTGSGKVKGYYEKKITAWNFFWGLMPKKIDLEEEKIPKKVKNAKITYQFDFLDSLVNIVTLGILNPKSIVIEADTIKG